jgi:hypothetical protein
MPHPASVRIAAIQSWSRFFGWGLTLVMVLLPLGMLAALLASRTYGEFVLVGWPQPVDMSLLSGWVALIVACTVMLQVAVYLLPLYFLRRLFGLWAKGEILTQAAAKAIRLTGISLLAAALTATLFPFLLSIGLAGITDGAVVDLDLGGLLAAGVIYVVGLVLREAAGVAEDAELTI